MMLITRDLRLAVSTCDQVFLLSAGSPLIELISANMRRD